MRKKASTNVVDESSTMIEINDYFAVSLLNAPNVEPPPRTVSSRAGEDSELRCSKHTRYPPQHFLLTLIDAIVLEEEKCCIHML